MVILMYRKPDPHTGKGKFMERLASQFEASGHEVVDDPSSPHDIYLDYNAFRWKSTAKKVLRLNGVSMNSAVDWKNRNKSTTRELRHASGVIYQSRFCKSMHHRYTGNPPIKQAVIFNGAKVSNVLESPDDYVVACARWRGRPHKRLKEIKEAVSIAGKELVIIEDIKDDDAIKKIVSRARVMVHIAWLDWCPNSVVESLCCGTPVITTNVGGTQELMRPGCGTILNLDKEYNMNVVDLRNPPEIDVNALAKCVNVYFDIVRRNANNEHVNISNIANQYIKFFKELV